MNARALTGQALAAALRKATTPAISAALARNAERLRAAVADAGKGLRLPSPLVGEGGTSSALRTGPPRVGAGTPHPDPLPQGERETAEGRVRVYALSGEFPKPSPAALRASTSPSGRGEARTGKIGRTSLSLDVTLSGEGLFAREFGAVDAAAEPVLAPAIERLRRRDR